MPVIGSLYGTSAAEWAAQMTAFRSGLGQTGFVEGRNVVIEYRWADSQFDRMPAMAAELVSRKVAVILVGGNLDGVRATMAAHRRYQSFSRQPPILSPRDLLRASTIRATTSLE
jgi:putative ABC transport system substrate-binding protein